MVHQFDYSTTQHTSQMFSLHFGVLVRPGQTLNYCILNCIINPEKRLLGKFKPKCCKWKSSIFTFCLKHVFCRVYTSQSWCNLARCTNCDQLTHNAPATHTETKSEKDYKVSQQSTVSLEWTLLSEVTSLGNSFPLATLLHHWWFYKCVRLPVSYWTFKVSAGSKDKLADMKGDAFLEMAVSKWKGFLNPGLPPSPSPP